jgi:serine/threonine-protein kinase
MKFRTLADLGQSALGPMRLVRVESGRYNGKLFALQRVDPSISTSFQLTSAILDDAFITAVVFSRNVVQFIAWGQDDEGTYIAIELVQGASLRHLLKAAAARKENIPDRIIGFICSELCAGLHALHSVRGPDGELMGLAHGRLGPTNVLLSFKGDVKIADVGLAAAKERVAQAKLGGAGVDVECLAPEQAKGQAPSAKSDLFSFGVLLFELLTGRPPWSAASPEELRVKMATEPPPHLGSLRKWCDPFFVDLVRACLEKEPGRRLASAGKVVELIAEWHVSRGFGEGDQEALAKLVKRLGSHQMEWFRRALAGELARPDATALLTALERVDFGVDPETRRAGGTIAPPGSKSEGEEAAARAVSVVPAPAEPPATRPEIRTSMRPPEPPSPNMRPPEPPSPNPKPARASIPEARPSEVPEPRPSVLPPVPEPRPSVLPPVPEPRPSVLPPVPEPRPSVPPPAPAPRPSVPPPVPAPRPSVPPPVPAPRPSVPPSMPEPRPSSPGAAPAAESWFPSMWPSAALRGGEEGRGSVPPSGMTPSARFAFVSRWAVSAEAAKEEERAALYRAERPSQAGPAPPVAKPGAWVAPGPPAGKGPPALPGLAQGDLTPPRLPSIASESSLAPLEGDDGPTPAVEAPPPSSRPEAIPATLRTGSHAIVKNLDKPPR